MDDIAVAKYVKNPEVVEAVRWIKVGDHPDITAAKVSESKEKDICPLCGFPLKSHGSTMETVFASTICPGKWIITREDGRIEYLDDATFQKRYTVVPEVIKS